MDNRFKIVVLPTDKATNILLKNGKPQCNVDVIDMHRALTPYQRLHFYIVDTHSGINVGDVVYHKTIHKVSDVFQNNLDAIKTSEAEWWRDDCWRVIASTDKSLCLPTLHPETIQRYTNNPQLDILDVSYNIGYEKDGKWINQVTLNSYELLSQVEINHPNSARAMIHWNTSVYNSKFDAELLRQFFYFISNDLRQVMPVLHKDIDNFDLFVKEYFKDKGV